MPQAPFEMWLAVGGKARKLANRPVPVVFLGDERRTVVEIFEHLFEAMRPEGRWQSAECASSKRGH